MLALRAPFSTPDSSPARWSGQHAPHEKRYELNSNSLPRTCRLPMRA